MRTNAMACLALLLTAWTARGQDQMIYQPRMDRLEYRPDRAQSWPLRSSVCYLCGQTNHLSGQDRERLRGMLMGMGIDTPPVGIPMPLHSTPPTASKPPAVTLPQAVAEVPAELPRQKSAPFFAVPPAPNIDPFARPRLEGSDDIFAPLVLRDRRTKPEEKPKVEVKEKPAKPPALLRGPQESVPTLRESTNPEAK